MLALLALTLLAAEPVAADVAVVCPRELRSALAPWVEYRQSQGHKLVLLESGTAKSVRQQIKKIAESGSLKHIVLVGDANVQRDPLVPASGVPATYVKAVVNVHYGSEPEIPTDNPYADLDDDGVPELSVGRIAVDRPEELSTVVKKIIAYETKHDHGPWRQRVNLVAGVGGFGAITDGTIELTTKKFLCEGIPSSYSTTMTYGSWRSPYCPDPTRFRDTVVEQFNQGSLFWVYIGHGHPERLDRIHVPGAAYSILDASDVEQLNCPQGSPIALLLACYTGAYDQSKECLAERMLRLPGGPIAVLAGSRITMPYAMAVLTNEMMTECFHNRPETLGELVLAAKCRSIASASQEQSKTNIALAKFDNRQLLDALGKLLSPKPNLLEEERREHLALFNLLGDPLLRIAYPDQVKVSLAEEAKPGESVPLNIESTLAGKCTVQLVCRRDYLTFDMPSRGDFTLAAKELRDQQATYLKANDHRFSEHVVELKPGTFEAELPIPSQARGPCHVRVFVQGPSRHALGAADIYIKPVK